MKFKKTFMTILVLLSGFGVVFFMWGMMSNSLNFSPGVCAATGRKLTDVQLINTVLKIVRADMARPAVLVGPDGSRINTTFKNHKYKGWNIVEGCCAVDRAGTLSLMARVLGKQKLVVWIKTDDSAGSVEFSDNKFYVEYDVCGNVINTNLIMLKDELKAINAND
ncbi:hypothetical protein [Pseudomonas sp. DWP3-1-2]|uniref:hypothetical protein n=1 Tax=Pseudomonas sp. DWP3-1-2 TaxID=2804645 RepID=UPI003CF5EFAA